MNKLLLVALLAAVPFAAMPKGSSNAGAGTYSTAGIVTPDIATGMRTFTHFNNDLSGEMVVCVKPAQFNNGDDTCGKNNKEWQALRAQVPKGREYIGFRIANSGYGYRVLELYWR